MTIENVTAIITDTINGTTAAGVDNYVYLFLVVGGIIGTFLGMMIPFLREKRKFGKEGIDLFFDNDFLKTAAFAFITSVISIGAIYPTLLAGADPSGSYISVLLAAATTAFTINIGGAWIIGTNNKEAEELLAVKKSEQLRASGKIDRLLAKLDDGKKSGSSTDALGGEGGVKNTNS